MHPSRLLVFYAFVVWTTVLFACGTYTGSIKRRSLLVTMMKAAGDNLQHDKGVCLMAKKITDTVTWVGKVDWELNEFHGHEYSTEKGPVIMLISLGIKKQCSWIRFGNLMTMSL